MKTAVLVIDVQQGLCEGEGKAFDCEGIISRINAVTHKARNSGVPVIFIQHESSSGYLEYDTAAWQLAFGLECEKTDIKIRKTTPDSFHLTELVSLLKDKAVENIIVCGMHTEFCVDTTVRRALALGYSVILVKDAHTSAGNAALSPQQVIDHHNLTLTNISSFGPRVDNITSEALILTEVSTQPP